MPPRTDDAPPADGEVEGPRPSRYQQQVKRSLFAFEERREAARRGDKASKPKRRKHIRRGR